MNKSKIGYRGIGADGRPIDWYYSWSPGGFGCSGGCDGCWAKAMPFKGDCPDCKAFRVHFHPERLGQPAEEKTPGVVLCNFTNDWLDPTRPDIEIDQVRVAMRRTPRHVYVTLTKNVDRLRAFVCWATPNVYHGLTIRNQPEADTKLPHFMRIPGNLTLSLEPLWRPVDISGLSRIQGVIVGHDNRRGAPGTDTLEHVRNVVAQCRAARIPVFVKQLWIDGKLRKDAADFPPDLRHRDLPWSMPRTDSTLSVKDDAHDNTSPT